MVSLVARTTPTLGDAGCALTLTQTIGPASATAMAARGNSDFQHPYIRHWQEYHVQARGLCSADATPSCTV
jgi:hypothetical protein